jgi:hypothetical protein
MKNGADEPELVRETRTQWVKTVSPEVVPTETTDQEVGTEVTTSNAAGDSAPVKGVKIENAHKSSGGKVGGSTKAAVSDTKKGGGGGGSKPKPAKPSKKKDVVQRYKEIEDKLDDIREEADRTRDSLDRLYGAEHEAAIQRLLELE